MQDTPKILLGSDASSVLLFRTDQASIVTYTSFTLYSPLLIWPRNGLNIVVNCIESQLETVGDVELVKNVV